MTTTAHIDGTRASVVAEEPAPHLMQGALHRAIVAMEADGWRLTRTGGTVRNGGQWLRTAYFAREGRA